jgi:regulatory protein
MYKTITAITVQKKNTNRVNIFLDGNFSFGLYIVNARHLKISQSITQEMIDKLIKDDQIEDGYQKALKFISYKPRTSFEVIKKLREKDLNEDAISIIIDKLIEKSYVDDLQYAKNWVENRSINKPRSKKLIKWELKNKQFSEEIISEVTSEMLPEEKLAILAAEKYARRLSGFEEDIFTRRLSGYLMRRGFTYSTVYSTVKRIRNEHCLQINENSNGK